MWRDACESMPSKSGARLEASQDPGWSDPQHTQSEGGVKGREAWGARGGVNGWKKNSRMLVLQLPEPIYLCSWTPKELCPCSYLSLSINRLLIGPRSPGQTWSPEYTQTRIKQGTHPFNHMCGALRQTTVSGCQPPGGSGGQLARESGAPVETSLRTAPPCEELKGKHRPNSYVPQRSVFANNCSETRDPRMCRVLKPVGGGVSFDRESRLTRCRPDISH